jgi:hypothetical protein
MKHHRNSTDELFSIILVMEQKFNTELHDLISKLPVPKSGFKSNVAVSKIQVAEIKFGEVSRDTSRKILVKNLLFREIEVLTAVNFFITLLLDVNSCSLVDR